MDGLRQSLHTIDEGCPNEKHYREWSRVPPDLSLIDEECPDEQVLDDDCPNEQVLEESARPLTQLLGHPLVCSNEGSVVVDFVS